MNEHAGPACALSVLIVGAFAILLHDKDQPPPASKPIARHAAESPARTGENPSNAPAPQPSPKPELPAKPLETTASVPAPKPRETEKRAIVRPIETSAVVKRPAPARKTSPAPTGPRPSFTVVEAGETLGDVATRVYGSTDAAEALWKANRDQLAQVDSPLVRGTLLRTP